MWWLVTLGLAQQFSGAEQRLEGATISGRGRNNAMKTESEGSSNYKCCHVRDEGQGWEQNRAREQLRPRVSAQMVSEAGQRRAGDPGEWRSGWVIDRGDEDRRRMEEVSLLHEDEKRESGWAGELKIGEVNLTRAHGVGGEGISDWSALQAKPVELVFPMMSEAW